MSWNKTGRAVGVKVYEQFSNAAITCLFLLRRFLQLLRTDECPQLCTRLSFLCLAFPAQQVYAGLLSIIPRRAQYLLTGAAAGIGARFSQAPCSQAAPDPPLFFWIKLQQVGMGDKGGEEEEEEKLKAEANLPGILMSHLGALPADDFPIAPYGGESTAQRSAAGNSSPTAVPLTERQHRENAAEGDQHTWSVVLPITSSILVKGHGLREPPLLPRQPKPPSLPQGPDLPPDPSAPPQALTASHSVP